jgi:hypothetical protein
LGAGRVWLSFEQAGCTFENLLLPGLEGLSLLGELIAEAFDLELQIGVAAGLVVNVAVVSPFVVIQGSSFTSDLVLRFGELSQIVLENNPITSFPGFQVFQGFIGPRHWESFDYRRNLVSCAKLDHPARIQWTPDGRTRHGLLSEDQRCRHDWHRLQNSANEVQDTFRSETVKVGCPVEWDVDRYQDHV